MSKQPALSDFMRDAVREKAARELNVINQRIDALGGVERARDALHTVASDLTMAAGAVASVTQDATVATKLKKLRKLVDDAHVLSTEVADALGVDAQRGALEKSRDEIYEALKSANIDPVSVMPSSGGDAQ